CRSRAGRRHGGPGRSKVRSASRPAHRRGWRRCPSADLAVDGQRELQIAEPAEVAGREQAKVGAYRTEGAEALALVELHLRNLDVARRVVVDDHGAGDELVQTLVRHTLGGDHVALDDEA